MNQSSEKKKQEALELLPELKEKLGSKADGVSDQNLLKFLHWKTDVNRASERFLVHLKWRKENAWAFDSNPPMLAHKDEKLKHILESDVIVAPTGMKDKNGNTVLVGRLRNNDMSDGRTAEDVVRMVLCVMDRAMEDEDTQMNGVAIFHDLNGLSVKNLSPTIPRILLNALIGHFPIRIQGAYLLNAPIFFRGMFSAISLMMPSKLRKRFHFFSSIDEIPIEAEEHLREHGGSRIYDSKEWMEAQIQRELDDCMDLFSGCVAQK